MRRYLLWAAVFLPAVCALATERKFDFGGFPLGQTPPGFSNSVAGLGKPGDWKVILDDTPSALPAFPGESPRTAKQAVLAQLGNDPTSEHFPLLIYKDDTFGDFTFTTQFKIMGGLVDQMAGIAFRIKDEKNFYVARASALDGTFRFYRVIDGQRDRLYGPAVKIPTNVWQELTIECEGNHINCFLNGQQVIPTITDTTFINGKIGFWTKADSVAYFAGTKITYVPRETMAQSLVQTAVRRYPHVVGLKVYALKPGDKTPRVVAGKDDADLKTPGGDTEAEAIHDGSSFFAKDKDKGTVAIIAPLRDRNGEPIAAVRVTLKALPGQNEVNAAARAQPIIKGIQDRITSLDDFLQ